MSKRVIIFSYVSDCSNQRKVNAFMYIDYSAEKKKKIDLIETCIHLNYMICIDRVFLNRVASSSIS